MVEYIGHATWSQVYCLFIKFFPETVDTDSGSSDVGTRFADIVLKAVQPVSMAALQGYFLLHKDDSKMAFDSLEIFLDSEVKSKLTSNTISSSESVHPTKDEELEQAVKARSRGPLTALEIDRMVFNPQPGWDKDESFFTGR